MKIIVVSDTHGKSEVLTMLEEKYKDADLFVHCGDLEDDPIEYPKWLFVRGNNDYFGGFVNERILMAGDHKILVTHSHRCSYFARKESLLKLAHQKECDIVLYGHTHCSDVTKKNGILLMNPGSAWQPRDGNPPSYGILTIKGLSVKTEIIFQPEW